jgi:hypothetical protein
MVSASGFASVMAEMVSHSRATVSLLREAVETGDLAKANAIGHSLKGLFLQFGAERAADAAGRIEAAAELGPADILIDILDAAVEEALAEYERDWCGDAA